MLWREVPSEQDTCSFLDSRGCRVCRPRNAFCIEVDGGVLELRGSVPPKTRNTLLNLLFFSEPGEENPNCLFKEVTQKPW